MAYASRPRNMRAASTALLIAAVSALLAEGALHLFPRSTFLDQSAEAFWLSIYRPGGGHDTIHDPELGWRMRPNYRSETANHDEQGLRITTPGVGPRVVAIGDSFTYGLGVADHETYASRLAEAGFSVVNAGTNAYGIDQAVLRLAEIPKPDVIVLGYYVDDFYRSALTFRDAPKPRLTEAGYEPPRQQAEPFGLRVIEAAEYIARRLGHYDRERFAKAEAQSHYLLTKLRDSGPLVVLIFQHSYDGQDEYVRVERSIEASCEALSIPCINVAEAMRGPEWASYYGPNHHFSPKGHALVADLVTEALRNPPAAAQTPAYSTLEESDTQPPRCSRPRSSPIDSYSCTKSDR
jgi:hypothetical protein